ncbi:SKU5 similar 17 isoform 2 [Hibiscus syriacus]|uniref:SKU5 similar 17 isoform 2 n=1 Tax=Hibiscus syriacus TaxID=106335 RepID=A0A6A2XV98_HIBSY|nr:SKU5 similar 17 isoform 2 [Hibiscus syriacus]
MGKSVILFLLAVLGVSLVNAEDPYLYFTWTATYGTRSILGVPQQVILINNQFPGPKLDAEWGQVKEESWQDGVLGTNCPIPPNSNYTYKFQAKDQIGSYNYFPSTLMHRAAGGFGALNIIHRSVIPIPYANPAGDFTCWISNVGLSTSLKFWIQNHKMKLVEVEGSHVIQNLYDSLDVHVGQSITILVTLDQLPKDYYIVASTRFTKTVLTATAVLHYTNSNAPVSGPIPAAPANQFDWSMDQARTYRWNLTSNAARPNPQGSFHCRQITPTKTFVLANSASSINGKLRYAVNGVSYINPYTPLKLDDHFNIPGVFSTNSISAVPSGRAATVATSVMPTSLHDFIEVIFQNNENTMQAWHLDGYDFWVVGGRQAVERATNLVAALRRHTDYSGAMVLTFSVSVW